MRREVQSEEDADRDEDEQRAQGHTVDRGQLNRFPHAKRRVSGKQTHNRRQNGVRRENKPCQQGRKDGVNDQRTMVFRDDFLWVHHVDLIRSNAGVEHRIADDAVAELEVHDQENREDYHQNGQHAWIVLETKEIV